MSTNFSSVMDEEVAFDSDVEPADFSGETGGRLDEQCNGELLSGGKSAIGDDKEETNQLEIPREMLTRLYQFFEPCWLMLDNEQLQIMGKDGTSIFQRMESDMIAYTASYYFLDEKNPCRENMIVLVQIVGKMCFSCWGNNSIYGSVPRLNLVGNASEKGIIAECSLWHACTMHLRFMKSFNDNRFIPPWFSGAQLHTYIYGHYHLTSVDVAELMRFPPSKPLRLYLEGWGKNVLDSIDETSVYSNKYPYSVSPPWFPDRPKYDHDFESSVHEDEEVPRTWRSSILESINAMTAAKGLGTVPTVEDMLEFVRQYRTTGFHTCAPLLFAPSLFPALCGSLDTLVNLSTLTLCEELEDGTRCLVHISHYDDAFMKRFVPSQDAYDHKSPFGKLNPLNIPPNVDMVLRDATRFNDRLLASKKSGDWFYLPLHACHPKLKDSKLLPLVPRTVREIRASKKKLKRQEEIEERTRKKDEDKRLKVATRAHALEGRRIVSVTRISGTDVILLADGTTVQRRVYGGKCYREGDILKL